jgi:hypothetical protein
MSCRDEIRILSHAGKTREHGAKPTLANADPAKVSRRIHPPVGWLVAGLVCDNAWPSRSSIIGGQFTCCGAASAMLSRVAL